MNLSGVGCFRLIQIQFAIPFAIHYTILALLFVAVYLFKLIYLIYLQ